MTTLNETVFWCDQFPRPDDLPLDNVLPEQVDVAIVGSGYTGLNTARILAKNSTSVVVLESETIGWGASSRNGGMATPGLKESLSTIHKRYGKQKAELFWQSSLDAIDLIEELVQEENIDCDWQRDGHIHLASKPAHFESMKKHAAYLKNEFGYTNIQVVERADLRSELGTDSFHGGLADDFSGGLQPAQYVYGLARAVARHGAHLCENTTVTKIEKITNGFTIHTSKGEIAAKEVVIATNGYTDTLVPKLKPKIFPVGSYIIVTEPLPPDLQQKLSPKGRMCYDSKNFLNYFRLTPDGRLLWGGRNDLSTDLDLKESAQRLQAQMIGVFPELKGQAITHTWTGKLGVTFDFMPHIGQINGIHYALGYGGHGLSIATYLGTEMGLLLLGQKKDSPYAQIPHQTKFYYRNNPWFLPYASKLFRFLDWLT